MKKYVWGLAAIAIMVIGFALPSQAASFKIGDSDWSLGGSVRLDTGWRMSDYGDVPAGANDSTTDFFLSNPGNSRIFAKAVYGKMTGYVELGLGAESEIRTRHIYASYDMGGGNSLLVGRTWTALAEDSPNQRLWDDDTLVGFGDLYAGRHEQIRFIHTQDKMTFQIALEDVIVEDPSVDIEFLKDEDGHITDITEVANRFGLPDNYTLENMLPAIILSLSYDAGNFLITPSLYAQTYTLKGNAEGVKDVDVTSYALALDAAVKAAGVTVSGEIWWGQNLSIFGLDMRSGASTTFGAPIPNNTLDDIKDVKSMGGWLQLAAPIKPGTLYAGAGYQQADTELSGTAYEDTVSTWGAFINYEYEITTNFSITPELAYFNYGKDAVKGDNKLGNETFVGAHFQYNF